MLIKGVLKLRITNEFFRLYFLLTFVPACVITQLFTENTETQHFMHQPPKMVKHTQAIRRQVV